MNTLAKQYYYNKETELVGRHCVVMNIEKMFIESFPKYSTYINTLNIYSGVVERVLENGDIVIKKDNISNLHVEKKHIRQRICFDSFELENLLYRFFNTLELNNFKINNIYSISNLAKITILKKNNLGCFFKEKQYNNYLNVVPKKIENLSDKKPYLIHLDVKSNKLSIVKVEEIFKDGIVINGKLLLNKDLKLNNYYTSSDKDDMKRDIINNCVDKFEWLKSTYKPLPPKQQLLKCEL